MLDDVQPLMHVPHLPLVPEEVLHKDVGHADPVASSWDMAQRVAFVGFECNTDGRGQESGFVALMVVDQHCSVVVGMRLVEVACKRRVEASGPCLVTGTFH